MKLTLPPTLVKQSLSGHSWLGLAVGALMYIVCLTGTLCVFFPAFERWEQANIVETQAVDIAVLEQAFNTVLSQDELVTDHMYLSLPTASIPRASVSNEETGWFVNSDGSLGAQTNHDWTHFLVDLHVRLTIPNSFGIFLVSTLGAMLCGLILSGFLSHPRIFKDAFKLRLDGKSRLEQVDIHNRLSVWASPFHLLMAFTGAYFGLVLPILGVVTILTAQNPADVLAEVYGTEPAIQQEGPMQVATALANLTSIAPDAEPFLITAHNAGSDSQFLEVSARIPERMIYAENYHFAPNGDYLGNVNFENGEVGRQVVYSMYYLHFGHFSGFTAQLIYAVLGLALTVVSVTGINIWLAKRNIRTALNDLWVGMVWGTPLVLLLSAISQISFSFVSAAEFWVGLIAVFSYCLLIKDEIRSKRHLQLASVIAIAMLLSVHALRFGTATLAPASWVVNGMLLLYLAYLVGALVRPLRMFGPATLIAKST